MIFLWDLIPVMCPQSKINLRFYSVHWRKTSKIDKKNELFGEEIEVLDVVQGQLGNCWLISAISALAQKPKIIKNLFIRNKALEELGIYKGRINQ